MFQHLESDPNLFISMRETCAPRVAARAHRVLQRVRTACFFRVPVLRILWQIFRLAGTQWLQGFTYNNEGLHNGGGLPLAVQKWLQENATTARTARIGRYVHSETAGCAPQHAPSNAVSAFGAAM